MGNIGDIADSKTGEGRYFYLCVKPNQWIRIDRNVEDAVALVSIALKLPVPYLDIMAHALGINLFHAIFSLKKKDKVLPNSFYRNYHQVDSNPWLDTLVDIGYAKKQKSMGQTYYYLTDIGIEMFKDRFAELVEYRPPQERDLDYLCRRIDAYCKFRSYRYTGINSQHILSSYVNCWMKKLSVSHSTEEVIRVFLPELKRMYKLGLLK